MSFARRTKPIKTNHFEDNFFKDNIEQIQNKDSTDIEKQSLSFIDLSVNLLSFICAISLTFFLIFYPIDQVRQSRVTKQYIQKETSFLLYFNNLQSSRPIQEEINNNSLQNSNLTLILNLLQSTDELVNTPLKNKRTYTSLGNHMKISYSNLNFKECHLFMENLSENNNLEKLSNIELNNISVNSHTIGLDNKLCSAKSNTLALHFTNK